MTNPLNLASITALTAGGGPSSGNLVHAYLKYYHGAIRFDFLINPKEVTLTKLNKLAKSTKKGYDVPRSEFLGGEPYTLDLQIVIDTSEQTGANRNAYSKGKDLRGMMTIDKNSRDPSNKLGSPPILEFHWGDVHIGPMIMSKFVEKLVKFDPDGTPTRTEIQLTLQQWSDSNERPKQNPTSGGDGDHRYYQVRPGQTLDLISYEVYGDSTRWRKIAEANGIDDPLAIRPGQLLRIGE